jgi:hypothetical protein
MELGAEHTDLESALGLLAAAVALIMAQETGDLVLEHYEDQPVRLNRIRPAGSS